MQWFDFSEEFFFGEFEVERFGILAFVAAALHGIVGPWFFTPDRAIAIAIVGLLNETAFVVMIEQIALILREREVADRRAARFIHTNADRAVVEISEGVFGGGVRVEREKQGRGGDHG